MALTSLYYEAATVIFFIWLLIACFKERVNLLRIIKNNKLASFLIIILLLSHTYRYIVHYASFIINLSYKFIENAFNIKTNFLFPIKYVNIDGNSMGWGNFTGLVKYYAYYVGTVVFLLLLIFLFLLPRDKQFRKYLSAKLKEKEILILLTIFILLFSISEIFPRLFSFSFLPERIWTIGSIFFIIIPYLLFNYFKKRNVFLFASLIIFTIISISGAIYINNLKKYVITQPQLKSASWIKKNLPKNRVIISRDHENLIQYHSQSDILVIPEESFTQKSSFAQPITMPAKENPLYDFKNFKQKTLDSIDDSNDYDSLIKTMNIHSKQAEDNKGHENFPKDTAKEYYVYYSQTHPKNPYQSRPYMDASLNNNRLFLDSNPKIFKKIYSDKENQIYIWKIL